MEKESAKFMTENKKKNIVTDLVIGLVISLFSLFLIIFMLEIGLRFMGYTTKHLFPKEFISKDGDFHTLAPNVNSRHKLKEFDIKFQTNSFGLRDKEYPEKTQNDYRILALGDSFTMGWGVEQDQVFTEVLERDFVKEKPYACNVEVLNGGVYGYGTVEELLFLGKKGLKLKPDLVILTFFIGNDIFENLDAYKKFFDKNGERFPVKKSLSISIVRFIRDHNMIYNFLMARFRNMKSFREYYNNQRILFDAGEPRDEIELYQKSRQESISDYWVVTKEIILKVKKICDDNNIKLVLITIPSKVQVYAEQWADISGKLGIAEDSDIELPDKILKSLCKDNGIHYCKLLNMLQEVGKKDKDLYFKLDRHWKAHCHEIVGNFLYDYLIKENLIECPK